MSGNSQGADMAEITTTVLRIIAEKAMLAPADLTPDMALADLGMDSLGMVETIFALEEAFDITIPFNAQDSGAPGFDISTIAAIIAGVEGLLAHKAA